jgi:hypothetical protein
MNEAIGGPDAAARQDQVEVIGATGDASISRRSVSGNRDEICRNVVSPSIRLALRNGHKPAQGRSSTELAVTTPKHNDSNGTGNCEFKQHVAGNDPVAKWPRISTESRRVFEDVSAPARF